MAEGGDSALGRQCASEDENVLAATRALNPADVLEARDTTFAEKGRREGRI